MSINPIIATVTYLQQIKAGTPIGTATGFLYTSDEKLFLVTNRHVVKDEANGIFPDALRLLLHQDANNIAVNGTYDVSLYSGSNELWREHPNHKESDVALLRLDLSYVKQHFFIQAWSSAAFLPSKFPLHPGEDVFVMGYPRGFFDEKNNLPVFRNAMIASVYGVNFDGSPCFLTDANLHPGTSGSPVITKPKSAWVDSDGNTNLMTGTIYYVVGIHSGTYSVQLADGTTDALGLGVAWYIQLVDDISKLF